MNKKDQIIKENNKLRIGLHNVRWFLKNPTKTIWELKGQLESADLVAKEALEDDKQGDSE